MTALERIQAAADRISARLDKKALKRMEAWLADLAPAGTRPHDYVPRFGNNRRVPYADLRAVLALAKEAADLRRALQWAHDALIEARREGLLGGDDSDDATDIGRAAAAEFDENMAPIRAALRRPLPKRRRG